MDNPEDLLFRMAAACGVLTWTTTGLDDLMHPLRETDYHTR